MNSAHVFGKTCQPSTKCGSVHTELHKDFELRLGYETHTFDISQTCLRAVQLLAEKNIPG